MDVCDIAQIESERQLDAILSCRPLMSSKPSETHCVECGVAIPEARRVAVLGCTHCVDCKQLQEIKGR